MDIFQNKNKMFNFKNIIFLTLSLIFISQANLVEAFITAPTDISDNVLWLDATDSSTLFTDAACSTQATVGDGVACWKDKSSQATEYKALSISPTVLSGDLNSKNTIHFANNGGFRGNYKLPANTSYTKAVIFKFDSAKLNNLISSNAGHALYGNNSVTRLMEVNYPPYRTQLVNDNAVDSTKYYMAVLRFGGPDSIANILNVDGNQKTINNNNYPFNEVETEIGSFMNNNFLDGKIAEAIMYNKALDDDEIDDVECYLSDKWNIPVSHTITSNGGGDTASINVDNGEIAVTTVTVNHSCAGSSFTYSITNGADQSKFSINSSTGVLTFNNAPDFENPTDADTNNTYIAEVKVVDTNGGADTQVITVTVTNANDTPTATAQNVSTNEDTDLSITLSGTDEDSGDTLTYTVKTGPSHGTFSNGTYSPTANYNGSDSFTFVANDGTVDSAEATISITVNPVNDAPEITSANNFSVEENHTAIGTVMVNNVDGDTITYSITNGADQAKFSINPSTGALTFNVAPDFEANGSAAGNNIYTVEITVTDSSMLTDVQTFTVTVTDVNEPDTDDDGDGVTNGEEDTAPNGDGNGDGILDRK